MNTPTTTKTKPVPTRFAPAEDRFIHDAALQTGLSASEVIRRSVRLCQRQQAMIQSYGFLFTLTPTPTV